jgi:hypothetical protein
MSRPIIFSLLLVTSAFIFAEEKSLQNTTTTGWFSDESCARSKIESGEIGPNGRECVQKCIAEGKKMVFIDEKEKAMYFVDNPQAAKGQESHYVRVVGTTDPKAKTLHVASVKVLEEYKAMCARPKLKQ